MRKVSLIVVLMLTLAVGATFILPQTAKAESPSRIVVYDIQFDGFCDGMHMELDTETKVVTANRTGCDSGSMEGTYKPQKVKLIDNNYNLLVRISSDYTWVYYDFNGNLFNSGTWSPGTPSAPSGTSSSTSR